MRLRSFVALWGACFVGGCGSVHQLPAISQANLQQAQAEVQASSGPPQRRIVSDEEVRETLEAATWRILASAEQVCREMNVGVCDWQFRVSPSRSLNAGSYPNGFIVVNRGIVEYAANEEEVCLVIGHEMGHQMANHLARSQRNQVIGGMIGAVLLGAAGIMASNGSYDSAYTTRAAAQMGAQLGRAVGQISFSKEQEREADYLAALILYRAGVDLDQARGFMVTMARASGKRETGMLDTHPAGPERVAGWDRAVAEIRASNGRLPPRT
jgi:predicted Zn-dependent protease